MNRLQPHAVASLPEQVLGEGEGRVFEGFEQFDIVASVQLGCAEAEGRVTGHAPSVSPDALRELNGGRGWGVGRQAALRAWLRAVFGRAPAEQAVPVSVAVVRRPGRRISSGRLQAVGG